MFKKLKSLFIVEDEAFLKEAAKKNSKKEAGENPDLVPEQPKQKPTAQTNPTNNSANTTANPNRTAPEGKVSAKFTDVLLGAMEKNNLDGYDYLEFKQSMQSLAKLGTMDEATVYKSAFAAAQPMGVNQKKLVDSAQFYLKILKDEESKFGQALQHQRSKQIGGREEQIKRMEQLILQKEKQIEQLKKEIELNRKEADKMKADISESTLKVQTTQNNFVASYKHITSQIQKDVANIKQYLGA